MAARYKPRRCTSIARECSAVTAEWKPEQTRRQLPAVSLIILVQPATLFFDHFGAVDT